MILEQLTTKKEITKADARAASDLLRNIIYAQESKILKAMKEKHALDKRDHHLSPHEKELKEIEALDAANQHESFIDYCVRMEPIWEQEHQECLKKQKEWEEAHPNRFKHFGTPYDSAAKSIEKSIEIIVEGKER